VTQLTSVSPFISATSGPSRFDRLLPDRVLGVVTLAMLALLATAVMRGHAHWAELPWTVWVHLATVMPAMALTPLILTARKGDRRHRALGYVWVLLLATTALVSFDIRLSDRGGWSWVHLVSAWTLVQLALIVSAARAHEIASHRRRVRGLVIGALLVAGFFTLPFGRLLGTWLTA
jgi:uncharacterized membrane protein